jgi:signal transduction histidine kinase
VFISLLTDVLDFTKLEAQRLSLEQVDFDLRTLLADVELLFQPLAVEKHLSFSVHVPADLGRARRGDPLRMRQVLTNLLSNAVKFTERGEVRLTVTEREPGVLRFEVRDSGIGISEELRAVVQPLRAGRRLDHAALRGHRAGAGGGASARRDDGRHH